MTQIETTEAPDLKAIGQIATDPYLFAATFLKILNLKKELVPLVYNNDQLLYLANRTRRDLILKPRQRGFSTAIQGELFRLGLIRTIRSTTLAHDDNTTQDLRLMVERFYEHFPHIDGMKPDRRLANARITTYTDTDSEAASSTAGSKNTGRGTTNTHIHGSEVAFWVDADSILTGLLQAGEPAIVLESTPNGAQGKFYNLCNEAMDTKAKHPSIWKLHFFVWWTDPARRIALKPGEVMVYEPDEAELVRLHRLTPEQIKWRRYKQKEIGDKFFQEYPENATSCFLSSGSAVFKDYTLYTPDEQSALDDHLYVMGIDWSGAGGGDDIDSHAVSIADATDFREVFAWTTRQRDDDAVLDEIIELVKRWRVIVVIPELNSMGATLSGRLHKGLHERGYDWGVSKRGGYSLAPVVSGQVMTNPVKDSLVKELRAGFKAGYKLVDDPTGNDELLSFVSRQLPSGLWTYGAKSGKHDDLMVARLLCFQACYAHKGY
jgi:hypothetical protein